MTSGTQLEPPKALTFPGQGSKSWFVKDILVPVASLRLTVFLFVLALVLVFCGTLAQVDDGIWTVVGKYFRSLFVWVPLQIFFPRDMNVAGGFPFPGGWLIGGLLLANLLAAHAIRFKLKWKRSGIFLIHSGIIVMMVSELVTGLYAVEGNMVIEEGKSANYLIHSRFAEIAVIDPSDSQTDEMVVIPQSWLQKRKEIRHEFLPFDIEIVRYMVNSNLREPQKGEPIKDNPATTGAGLRFWAEEIPEFSGTDPNQKVESPSAYVTLKDKNGGKSLGTYLFSIHLKPQPVQVNGKTYNVELRFKRTYKPYTIHLIDFRHDKYIGTETARNFSSEVRLVDPSRNEDREFLIYMNNPLRYGGETFYQSSFLKDERSDEELGTILQVVRNPGWLMPYISCAMVSGGMLIHFGLHLAGFLRRRFAA